MKIEREHFEAWLFSQSRDRQIQPTHCHDCFIGRFLQEVKGVPRPLVLSDVFVEASSFETPKKEIPLWLISLLGEDVLRLSDKPYLMSCGQLQARYLAMFPDTFIPKTLPQNANKDTGETLNKTSPNATPLASQQVYEDANQKEK